MTAWGWGGGRAGAEDVAGGPGGPQIPAAGGSCPWACLDPCRLKATPGKHRESDASIFQLLK